MKYLDIEYNERNHPKTAYPVKLARHLCKRFSLTPSHDVKFLEVGCGRGDFINAFCELGFAAYAIDLADRHEELDQKVKFMTADLNNEAIPMADNSVDVIFSKSVLEHIVDYHHFMAELKRVLKKNGKIIIMTPDWNTTLHLFYDDFTHIHPYTKTSLKNLLLYHDFGNVTAEIFYQLPTVWQNPFTRFFSKSLRVLGPPKKIYRNKFFRWSRELMILAYGEKVENV
jgi:SAM-dependent methyltransferase